jgi:hypothetical protein
MARRNKTTKARRAPRRSSTKLRDLEAQADEQVRGGADWEAMKEYRVWEANRKVYVYPENWLKP